jgi:hypothetical protein
MSVRKVLSIVLFLVVLSVVAYVLQRTGVVGPAPLR